MGKGLLTMSPTHTNKQLLSGALIFSKTNIYYNHTSLSGCSISVNFAQSARLAVTRPQFERSH